MMPGMGNSHPRLGLDISPRRKSGDCPRFSEILRKSRVGNSSVSENGNSRYLISSKNYPNFGANQVGEARRKMIPKIWHPHPLLGSEIGPRQTAARCPRFPKIYENHG